MESLESGRKGWYCTGSTRITNTLSCSQYIPSYAPVHMSTWGPPDLLLTENESWFVPQKVMAWGSNRKQEEDRRGSGDSRGERDGWRWRCVCVCVWGGVPLTLWPSHHPCQHWWLQRAPLWAHLARRDAGSGIRVVTASMGITVSYLYWRGVSSINVCACVWSHTCSC